MISTIIEGEVLSSASANNTYLELDNFGYHEKPNSIIVLLYIESLK